MADVRRDRRSPLVYVAGPLGDKHLWNENTRRAIEWSDRLIALAPNVVTYVPHSYGPRYEEHSERGVREYEWWLHHCLQMVRRCDALLRVEGPSPGADREAALAHRIGLPVFHSVERAARALVGAGDVL